MNTKLEFNTKMYSTFAHSCTKQDCTIFS